MADVTVITNNVPRDVLHWWCLTPEECADFEYIKEQKNEDSAQFARYKGNLIDLNDLEVSTMPTEWMEGWDAYQSDSFFSGILVKFVNDFEQVVMGRYYC